MNKSLFKEGIFKNKNVIVTGGGSGIGLCIAQLLVSLGAQVIIYGRNIQKLKNAVAIIEKEGGKALYFRADLRLEEMVKKVVSETIEQCGEIHGLVNNAGGQFPAPLAQISKRGFDAVIETNLSAGFVVSREVYNQSMMKHGGAIVNIIANMWGGMPGMGHSGAAREGMLNLTKTAAVEWAESGVRVNAVAPGIVWSSGMETYDKRVTEYIAQCTELQPIKRAASVDEIAYAVIFLLSDMASFMTGACMNIDGGASLDSKFWPLPESDLDFGIPDIYLDSPKNGSSNS